MRTSLNDLAYSLISGLSEHYKEAGIVLKKRFGNKQMLVVFYMDRFVQLPVVKNSNEVSNLRKLYDKIEISIRGLDSLNVKKETFRNLSISIINVRLPEGLRLYLGRKFKNNFWKIDDILNFPKIDVKAKERLVSNSNYDKSFDGSKGNKSKNSKGIPLSSHQRCSIGKSVLRNFVKFTGNHLCQSLFFNKVAGLRPATLLKKRLWHRCFALSFTKVLRTSFLQNTSA